LFVILKRSIFKSEKKVSVYSLHPVSVGLFLCDRNNNLPLHCLLGYTYRKSQTFPPCQILKYNSSPQMFIETRPHLMISPWIGG
jgi:hypothetical protein